MDHLKGGAYILLDQRKFNIFYFFEETLTKVSKKKWYYGTSHTFS